MMRPLSKFLGQMDSSMYCSEVFINVPYSVESGGKEVKAKTRGCQAERELCVKPHAFVDYFYSCVVLNELEK